MHTYTADIRDTSCSLSSSSVPLNMAPPLVGLEEDATAAVLAG